MSKKPIKMFMRFYGKTEPEVRDFLAKVKVDFPKIKSVRKSEFISSATLGGLFFEGEKYEFNLYFNSKEDLEEVMYNSDLKQRYDKFMSTTPGAEPISIRKPGDMAFGG